MPDVSTKASVLTAALPYIQKYWGKVVVIKYGGNAMTNETLKAAVMSDIVLLNLVGIKVVLVHGGGPEITSTLTAMGIASRFVNGLRYTDEETAKVVQMVLCGKTNKDLVKLIASCGGKAIGLSGLDGAMIKAEKLQGEVDLGFVGEITGVDTAPIVNAMEKGYIPVVATVGVDAHGQVYNINADTAAAAIATALKAENIILMTDIQGLMRDVHDESSLISFVDIDELEGLIDKGVVTGGMIPKVRCCEDAVRGGVKKAVMIDGRVEHSILLEIFSDEGIGTMLYKGAHT
ncbi:MAG: acetylglutamate kinase [Oscillospiraceae bacterium]|jgi:acetylglutamate kinase|nr:acetylglutamate kinase [Oscillospiraceae bacterium]